MKKFAYLILIATTALSLAAFAGEPAPKAVLKLVQAKVTNLAADPVIVEAVKTQNAKKSSLNAIQKMDKKWQATPGIAPFMASLMDSPCAKQLRAAQAKQEYYSEIFVVDNQGANVCMTDKTSDYWQGDEAKFTKSFTGGAGRIFVDDVNFDDSSQAYVVQASVPVVEAGQAIGVLVVSIDVDKVL
jgi:hypothetical protein